MGGEGQGGDRGGGGGERDIGLVGGRWAAVALNTRSDMWKSEARGKGLRTGHLPSWYTVTNSTKR